MGYKKNHEDYIKLFDRLNHLVKNLQDLGEDFPILRYVICTNIHNPVGDDVTYVDYSTQLSCQGLQDLVNSLEDQYVDDNTDFDVDKHISELLNGPARS